MAESEGRERTVIAELSVEVWHVPFLSLSSQRGELPIHVSRSLRKERKVSPSIKKHENRATLSASESCTNQYLIAFML